jgi:excisionase family DNA binding protein
MSKRSTALTNTTWLGVADVAKMLGLSKSKTSAMAKAGEIPAYRFGSSYRFAKDEVEQWIEAQRIPSHG